MPKERSVTSTILTIVVFIFLEIASLLLLSHNNQLQRLWFMRISHGFSAKVWGVTQKVNDYFSLKQQNEKLALENGRLTSEVRSLRMALNEADSTFLPELKENGFMYVPATIVKSNRKSQHNYLILDKGLPEDLKACFYNEGLTMHYSAKPYDNQAVKRRNVEERYRLEYLRLSFWPNDYSKDSRRFKQPNDMLAFNYLLLLNDLMPYYKAHSPQRHAWLNSLFTDVFAQILRNNISGYGFGGNMFHINVVTEGGLHYEVVQEPYLIENPEDDEATRQRKRDEQKAKTRVIIKTEPETLPSPSLRGRE